METRSRIHYKEKYQFAKTCAIWSFCAFLLAMLFLVRAVNANLKMQAKFISPNGVMATMEVK